MAIDQRFVGTKHYKLFGGISTLRLLIDWKSNLVFLFVTDVRIMANNRSYRIKPFEHLWKTEEPLWVDSREKDWKIIEEIWYSDVDDEHLSLIHI